jgi:Family of unknown function (DUF6152)
MMHRSGLLPALVVSAFAVAVGPPAQAHHSFAMYDLNETYVFTGVVVRVDPNPNHLQLFFAPLNENRDQVLKDDNGEPIVWSVEMMGAAQEAKDGISVNGFPRGTIFSVGLHPLRNGKRAGGRRESGLFKCPANTPPPPGKHCDTVPGATAHGPGVLPEPTRPAPLGEP